MWLSMSQLELLLGKNINLQRRSIIATILEILLPSLFAVILLPVRSIVKSNNVLNDTVFKTFNVDAFPFDLQLNVLGLLSPVDRMCIGYYPKSSERATRIMAEVATKLRLKPEGFDDEAEMISYVVDQYDAKRCLAAVNFRDDRPESFAYDLRYSYSPRNSREQNNLVKLDRDWKTNLLFALVPILGPRDKKEVEGGNPGYFREGFLQVQKAIDFALIREFNSSIDDVSLEMRRFPYPPYNDDNFVAVIQALFPFIIMLSFVFTVILTAKAIVYEKETGIKEAMKLMGMKPWIYWLSWYIKTFILILPSLIFMIIAYKVKVKLTKGGYAAIIDKTDTVIFTIFMLLYTSSSITFTFLCTTFFKKANSAAAGAGIIWFFSYLPYIFISLRYETMTLATKILAAFVNNLAMSEGIQLIGMFEGKGVGINWSNWHKGISVDDDFALIHVMAMLVLINIIHILLLFYFEQVLPGQHGIARPWHFPFTTMCAPRRKNSVVFSESVEMKTASKNVAEDEDVFIEDESAFSKRNIGIIIKNLFKNFKQLGKVKRAVNNLSLNIYEGQITVLLGHNGAGKSTTISMITGICEPDAGNILINGVDIVKDTQKARSVLGYCPQHNLLFDDLTVMEHLEFFSKLKQNYNREEIVEMLEMLNLYDKKDALSKTLSGGMKRKLSVAIAFIGGSKIVILDEPSSGMDPQARHSTWSLLQKFRKEKNCTILLTTHFMDEADILGDRIAIMSRGSLKCCGSPLYLKSKYGSGYNLVLTRKRLEGEEYQQEDTYKTQRIISLVEKTIPNSKVNSNISSEISFLLPSEYASKFPELFEKLEARAEKLDIVNIGISITTVEEVFLRIGDNENVDEEDLKRSQQAVKSSNGHAGTNNDNQDIDWALWVGSKPEDKNSGFKAIVLQFYALTIKRIIHSLRNKVLIISQILIPIGVVLINLIYLKYGPVRPTNSPVLDMAINKYSKNYIPLLAQSNSSLDGNQLVEQLTSSYQNNLATQNVGFDILHKSQTRLCPLDTDDINNYLICVGRTRFNALVDEYLVGVTFRQEAEKVRVVGHFNNQPYHIPPLALNLITNSLYKHYTSSNHSISTRNYPLPRNINEIISDIGAGDLTSFNIATGLAFGFSFLLASFGVFLIKERVSNSKHLQYMNGANSFVFWISALVWDILNYILPVIIVIGLLFAFSVENFVYGLRWLYMLLILVLYGLAHIPQMYLMSNLFKVSASGFAALTAWNILTSQATLTPVGIISLPQLELQDVASILEWVFLIIFPNFNMGQALIDMYINSQTMKACQNYTSFCNIIPNPCCKEVNAHLEKPCGLFDCANTTESYLRWEEPGLGRYITFLVLQFVIMFGIVLAYEGGYLRRAIYSILQNNQAPVAIVQEQNQLEELFGDIMKDHDVINEENRISSLVASGNFGNADSRQQEIFIIDRLTKHYANFMAVKGISFSLEKAQCFGLLGVNGAGKTTSFKMITGDEFITNGDAYLNGVSIKSDIKKFQQQLGYCPQFDPLIDQMTVLETMYMYARLRGIRSELIHKTCLSLIQLLDLSDHIEKMCYTLSGGNKRKLSVAISLIGSPCVVLLDEPTSGMDPKTRRTLWNCLNSVRNKGKSLILTTHSMDETEALCTNIGIMVNGELKCLGSLQHLKSVYGEGYSLLVKMAFQGGQDASEGHGYEASPALDNTEIINRFVNFVLNSIENSYLKEVRDSFVSIHIRNNSFNILSKLFALIETNKEAYFVEHYMVTQTNLEQIFLNFATKQIDPETRFIKGCSCCC